MGTFILIMFGDGVVAQVVLSNGEKGEHTDDPGCSSVIYADVFVIRQLPEYQLGLGMFSILHCRSP